MFVRLKAPDTQTGGSGEQLRAAKSPPVQVPVSGPGGVELWITADNRSCVSLSLGKVRGRFVLPWVRQFVLPKLTVVDLVVDVFESVCRVGVLT